MEGESRSRVEGMENGKTQGMKRDFSSVCEGEKFSWISEIL